MHKKIKFRKNHKKKLKKIAKKGLNRIDVNCE